MPNILLIFDRSDTAIADVLQLELEGAFEGDSEKAHVERAFDVAHARSKLPGTFDLVITTLDLREDRTSARSVDEERGVELFRWMKSSGIDIPGLVIAPSYTDKLRTGLPELGKCYVILSGTAMVQDAVRLAKQVAKKGQQKCLDVEIQIRDAGDWIYKINGSGFPVTYAHESNLQIDRRDLADLRTFSGAVATAANWTDILHSIGGKLAEVMLRNGGFFGDVVEGLAHAGGEENSRVRFTVNPNMHDLTLEALLCPRREGEHWMLRAPVYRKLLTSNPSTGGCLFQGGAKINCLIIEAQASGLVFDLSLNLAPLPTIAKECDWLKSFLGTTAATANIEHVERLPRPGDDRSLAQQVKEQLESREWTIVHFAGHSHFEKATQKSYVFLPGAAGKSVETVELERFSDWLLRATFTYFSSCDSGAGPFVFGLANRHVPNILGFRWEINDTFALEFSQTFYETLFAARSLERAFLKAQQKMYEVHRDDRIWAAPILVKQLDERNA